MAWRAVVQPNGKYAIFSDIVQDFTMLNMSREEAVECCFREIADGEIHYREQCRRLGVTARGKTPKDWFPHEHRVWRKQAQEKVLRAEQDPSRWEVELDQMRRAHRTKRAKTALAYDRNGKSQWPEWLKHQERTRRFKKGDRVIPQIRGVLMTVHEVLPFKWYILANEAGPVGRWKDHELDPAPIAVQA